MPVSWLRRFFVALLLCAGVIATTSVVAEAPAQAATQCYSGSYKGLTYFGGEWHHYVEFPVNVSMTDNKWYLKSKPGGFPFSASLWPGYYQAQRKSGPSIYKEIGYQWPYNWVDPYSASSWVICHT